MEVEATFISINSPFPFSVFGSDVFKVNNNACRLNLPSDVYIIDIGRQHATILLLFQLLINSFVLPVQYPGFYLNFDCAAFNQICS